MSTSSLAILAWRRFLIPLLLAGLATMTLAAAKRFQVTLTPDQKAEHVLNPPWVTDRGPGYRTGPQDGCDGYIEQQRHPGKDRRTARVEARLAPLETLKMSPAGPWSIIQIAYQLWVLMQQKADGKELPGSHQGYYEKYVIPLKLPEPQKGEDEPKWWNRLSPSKRLSWNIIHRSAWKVTCSKPRLIRADYSQRQLEEQMVDFWMNHIHVYMQRECSVDGHQLRARRHPAKRARQVPRSPAGHRPAPADAGVPRQLPKRGPGSKSKGLNENYGVKSWNSTLSA